MKPGVTGDWSVRDILAHVSTWEEEALTHLPLILEGGTPARYGNGDETCRCEPAALRGDRGRARAHRAARVPSHPGAGGRRGCVVGDIPRRIARLSAPAREQQHRGVARDDRTPQGARPPARIASPCRDRRAAGAPREGRQP